MQLKSVIIDNGLSNASMQTKKFFITDNSIKEDTNFNNIEPTHGDNCADVFSAITNKAFNISIRLISKNNGKLNTSDFTTAVKWCSEQNASLVCMSLSSNEPYDMPMLTKIFGNLRDSNTVFVASAANSGTLSAPACLDGVFGVCDDRNGTLDANQIGFIEFPIDGINWVYPSYMPNGFTSHFPAINSL